MAEGLLRSNKTRDGIAAALADNLGWIEEDIFERQEQWSAEQQKFRDMEAALEQGGLRVLNTPNLLKQNYWTTMPARSWTEDGETYTLPAGDYIYGNVSRIGHSGPYMKSIRSSHGQDPDEITESLITLTGDDIITEPDGESYNRPIAFTVTNPPEQGGGNADQLIYVYGWGTSGTQGLLELEDGKEYTMSCWAKVTSGTKMRLRFGWGENQYGYSHSPSNESLGDPTVKYIEINNTTWERVTWRFTYHATQTWTETFYTNTAAEGEPPVLVPFDVTYTENYPPRVSFGVCREYAGTVQMCGFRLVKGRLWICDTYDGLEDGINENKSAIQDLESADREIMANLAEAEEETATANHAVGDLFTMDGKTYRATAAITAGSIIAPRINCVQTTIASEIALSADAVGVTPGVAVNRFGRLRQVYTKPDWLIVEGDGEPDYYEPDYPEVRDFKTFIGSLLLSEDKPNFVSGHAVLTDTRLDQYPGVVVYWKNPSGAYDLIVRYYNGTVYEDAPSAWKIQTSLTWIVEP